MYICIFSALIKFIVIEKKKDKKRKNRITDKIDFFRDKFSSDQGIESFFQTREMRGLNVIFVIIIFFLVLFLSLFFFWEFPNIWSRWKIFERTFISRLLSFFFCYSFLSLFLFPLIFPSSRFISTLCKFLSEKKITIRGGKKK